MDFVILPREEIRLQADGFSLCKGDDQVFSIRWRDIREIIAFKRDLLTSDCVVLAFRPGESERMFEVHEELDGFVLLSDEMMRRFPTISGDWFGAVAQPPFATNWIRLFGEPSRVG